MMSIVDCTDLSGKGPHKKVGMGSMLTLMSLNGRMVCALAGNARGMDSIPALGAIFHKFIIHTTRVAVAMILYKQHAESFLNLSCVCIGEVTA